MIYEIAHMLTALVSQNLAKKLNLNVEVNRTIAVDCRDIMFNTR